MLVIPLYYSVLTAMTSSKRMQRWFPGRSTTLTKNVETAESNVKEADEKEIDTTPVGIITKGQIILLLAPVVWSIVALSELMEDMSTIPGSSIAIISILSCILSKVLSSLYTTKIKSDIGSVTQQLSDMCYFALLSVIGVSMNLRSLTLSGWWCSASSAFFATMPLIIHFAVLLVGLLGFMKMYPSYKVGIVEVAAASNSGICGPFTAAALVGKLTSRDRKDSGMLRLKGLALAATFWGIVGYAVATNIGVSISKALLLKT